MRKEPLNAVCPNFLRAMVRLLRKGKQILITGFFHILTRSKKQSIRNLYWNYRASDIHKTWGEVTGDYLVIKKVIAMVRPTRILDIGCGSGRLFPVFNEMNIPEVIAQDVASNAINICKKRFPGLKYTYRKEAITKLGYPENYFDLVISNRVLSTISPGRIESALEHLSVLGRYIYMNELSDTDAAEAAPGSSTYWFKHDYGSLIKKYGFRIIMHGVFGKQSWFLYSKIDRPIS